MGSIERVSIRGTRVLRTEDPRFLTTGGVYTDELDLAEVGPPPS